MTSSDAPLPFVRRIFCNRTLNLRAIRAIGYDMDYTLIHYRAEKWEERAYERLRRKLLDRGWPLEDLSFDPHLVIRGLILDVELGNALKADRFGYVKRAAHGTRFMDFDAQRKAYARTIVDLSEPRYVFLNTLFSLSEACMYAQLVDLLDGGRIGGVRGYDDLYKEVKAALDAAHVEGELKAEITENPAEFVVADPEAALALYDQKLAGKKLVLITNSEWSYTRAMMSYAFDPYLPGDTTWRDLFSLVIVSARKPKFFLERLPHFEVVSEDGLLRPDVGRMHEGKAYLGGDARLVEECLGLSGSEILYVGDHLYVDVRVTKQILRWRTALVVPELEPELEALEVFRSEQAKLDLLMAEKEAVEHRVAVRRLELLRAGAGGQPPDRTREQVEAELDRLFDRLRSLDEKIAPIAMQASELANTGWGLIMRAGADKSHFARQVERYSDVYLTKVSNFYHETPYCYLRSRPGGLPHDDVIGQVRADYET